MKKTKAKPVKGSARTKKFDNGGLAALAGLGALAYMMRKKKGEGSVPTDKSGYSSGPVDVRSMIEGKGDEAESMSAEAKRAMAASKGRPDLVPEGADEAAMRSDVGIKRAMSKPKKTTSGAGAKSVVSKAEDKPASVGMTGIPVSSDAGKSNEELPSKPYPKNLKASVMSPKGTQDVGKALGMSSNAKGTQTLGERIRGSVENAGRSVVTTPAQRMAEAARMVEERRRKEREEAGMKRGGKVKKYASGGSVSSASKRADGIAQRGKTKGRIC
jgi:hypothetical protein